MANSTQLITDLGTVQKTGFTNTTLTNASQPQGVIEDMPGNVEIAMVGLTDARRTLTEVLKDVDPNDPMLQTLTNVIASLS